ncbi:MAG: FecR domain-containing protein [Opitutaceae bacterium]|jgi:hypothetical protein|nr:FecR domain-containing protein [Opitutaceae bacterium]
MAASLHYAATGAANTPEANAAPVSSEKTDGAILVIRVTGEAYATGPDGAARTPLAKGARVVAGQTIVTDRNASVMLVLSNGATLTIAGGSELAVEEFSQQPFADSFRVTEISREPTSSTTDLHLKRGEIISSVKKLNTEGGSNFRIKTPVGVAGIRGTTFRLDFRETSATPVVGLKRYGHVSRNNPGNSATGKLVMVFDLLMLEGEIETRLEGHAAPTPVTGEKQLRIDNIHLDGGTGKVDAASLANPVVRKAPASELASLRRTVNAMLSEAASEVITPAADAAPKPAPAPAPAPKPAPLPPSPDAQVPPPRLLPTDGG